MERLDFEEITGKIAALGNGAKATFMYKLIQKLEPGVLRSTVKYVFMRLDKINSELPEGHPYREYYKKVQNDRNNKVHSQPGEPEIPA